MHWGHVTRVAGVAFHWLRLLPVRDFGWRLFCANCVPPHQTGRPAAAHRYPDS